MKRPKSPTIGFRGKRSESGQWNTSLVKYVRGYERSSICPLSTTLAPPESSACLPSSLPPSLSHNGPFTLRYPAALRDAQPFLSSVQFKENTCQGHVPIHSYGFAFASMLDTRVHDLFCEFCVSAFLKCNIPTYNVCRLTHLEIALCTRSTRSLFPHELFRYGLANAALVAIRQARVSRTREKFASFGKLISIKRTWTRRSAIASDCELR